MTTSAGITIDFYHDKAALTAGTKKFTLDEELPMPKNSTIKTWKWSRHTLVNYGSFSCTIFYNMDAMPVYPGMIIMVYLHGELHWKGRIFEKPTVTKRFKNNLLDEISISGKGVFYDIEGKQFTAADVDAEDNYSNIDTNAYELLTELFMKTEFGSYFTGSNVALASNASGGGCTEMEFNTGWVDVENIDISRQFSNVDAIDVLRLVRDNYNGTKDLLTEQEYIYWVDSNDRFQLTQRSAETLYRFNMVSSIEVDNTTWDIDYRNFKTTYDNNIINSVTVNDTEMVLTGVSETLRQASINTGGTKRNLKPYAINNKNITPAEFLKVYKGIGLNLSMPLVTHSYRLNPYKWRWHPINPANLSGNYGVNIDGVDYITEPVISLEYEYSTVGVVVTVKTGVTRASIDARLRAVIEQEKDQSLEPDPADDTPPTVSLDDSDEIATAKEYKKAKANFRLKGTATDDNGVTDVKFYVSKLTTPPSTWSGYVLIGSANFVEPTETTEGYYIYNQNDGYRDLADSPHDFTRGTIFRIKMTATDPSVNLGDDVKEYQLETEAKSFSVSLDKDAEADETEEPNNFFVADNFMLRFDAGDLDVGDDGFTCAIKIENYAGGWSSLDVTKVDEDTEHYWTTEVITKPAKGYHTVVRVIQTTRYGEVTTKLYHVAGIEKTPSIGVSIAIADPDTAADAATVSAPEFTDDIEFKVSIKSGDWLVEEGDVQFNIYYKAFSTTVAYKTIKHDTTPYSLAEDPVDSGIFICTTIISSEGGLGLAPGLYYAVARTRARKYYFTSPAAPATSTKLPKFATQDPEDAWIEGPPNFFEIVGATRRTRRILLEETKVDPNKVEIDDHTDRLPAAETGTAVLYDGDTKKAQTFFFDDIINPAPDGGDAGHFSTNDALEGSPTWTRMAAGNVPGTTDSEFTVNNNQSAGQYTSLKLDSNHSTNKCIIRYDSTGAVLQFSEDNGATYRGLASDSIGKVFTVLYELRVNASDGSLTFTKDPDVTPVVLFKISNQGELTVYDGIYVDADETHDLAAQALRFADAYLSGTVNALDFKSTNDGGTTEIGRLEGDVANNILIPHNMANGFENG